MKWFDKIFSEKKFECPICQKKIKAFLPFGIKPRPNALCPECKSLERHRLVWLYFRDETNLFSDCLKMLHVAPEAMLSTRFQKMKNLDYTSADLNSPDAMVKMDLEHVHFEDSSFDVIYASHVFEHIENDVRAMRELYRILRPNGWAILQVPILGDKTIEDPTIKTPEEREKAFGQSDHVRTYGHDNKYRERLEESGFKVTIIPYAKTLGPEKYTRYGLMEGEDIYLCKK